MSEKGIEDRSRCLSASTINQVVGLPRHPDAPAFSRTYRTGLELQRGRAEGVVGGDPAGEMTLALVEGYR